MPPRKKGNQKTKKQTEQSSDSESRTSSSSSSEEDSHNEGGTTESEEEEDNKHNHKIWNIRLEEIKIPEFYRFKNFVETDKTSMLKAGRYLQIQGQYNKLYENY